MHSADSSELLWPEPFSRQLHVEALAAPEPELPLYERPSAPGDGYARLPMPSSVSLPAGLP